MKAKFLLFWETVPRPVRDLLYNFYYAVCVLPGKLFSAAKGFFALKKLQRRTGRFCLVCPFGIGDILFAVKAMQSKLPRQDLAILVRTPYASLAGLFPDVLIVADTASCRQVENYITLFHAFCGKQHFYCYFQRDWQDRVKHKHASSQYSLWKDYCKLVYQIPEDAVADCAQKAIRGGSRRLSRDDIVLMPYAHSTDLIPASFWVTLAAQLKEKGYQVYTNIAAEEAPVEGTVPLQIPLDEVPSACEDSGGCIAVRSGVCDLLAAFSFAKLFVIDTSEHWAPIWDVTFFRKANIHNYVFQSESIMIREILKEMETEDAQL